MSPLTEPDECAVGSGESVGELSAMIARSSALRRVSSSAPAFAGHMRHFQSLATFPRLGA
eukprot:86313-Prymnesium_polylepis.1